MKNKILVFPILFLILSGGCSAPGYIPEAELIDVNQYGSYIDIMTLRGKTFDGELIAVDDLEVTILAESGPPDGTVLSIAIADIDVYHLHYAQPVGYAWTIPVFSLFTITHGWFLVLTFPANLITTIAVSAGGSTAFRYSDSDISLQDLKMFARFPQGIPKNFLKNKAVQKV